jgi:hypothetical protein
LLVYIKLRSRREHMLFGSGIVTWDVGLFATTFVSIIIMCLIVEKLFTNYTIFFGAGQVQRKTSRFRRQLEFEENTRLDF